MNLFWISGHETAREQSDCFVFAFPSLPNHHSRSARPTSCLDHFRGRCQHFHGERSHQNCRVFINQQKKRRFHSSSGKNQAFKAAYYYFRNHSSSLHFAWSDNQMLLVALKAPRPCCLNYDGGETPICSWITSCHGTARCSTIVCCLMEFYELETNTIFRFHSGNPSDNRSMRRIWFYGGTSKWPENDIARCHLRIIRFRFFVGFYDRQRNTKRPQKVVVVQVGIKQNVFCIFFSFSPRSCPADTPIYQEIDFRPFQNVLKIPPIEYLL